MQETHSFSRRGFLGVSGLALTGRLVAVDKTRKATTDRLARLSAWEEDRRRTLERLRHVLGGRPEDYLRCSRKQPKPDSQPTNEGCFTRTLVSFGGPDGTIADDPIQAYLLVPNDSLRQHAAVLCLHQTSCCSQHGICEPAGVEQGCEADANMHYAMELAQLGFVTLVPDYSNDGSIGNKCDKFNYDKYGYGFDFKGAHYQNVALRSLRVLMRSVDVLQRIPNVDPDRIGCIGHSAGANYTLFLSSFDQRIRAIVCSCGVDPWKLYAWVNGCTITLRNRLPRIHTLYEDDPSKMPFDFVDVLKAFAPRPLFVNAPLEDQIAPADPQIVGCSKYAAPMDAVRQCVNAVKGTYRDVFGAEERVCAEYPPPPTLHDFPKEVRDKAYAFLRSYLQE